jgi:hypothetical protein
LQPNDARDHVRSIIAAPPSSSHHSAPLEETIGDADLEFELTEVLCTLLSSSLPQKPTGASPKLEAKPKSSPEQLTETLSGEILSLILRIRRIQIQ